MLFFHVPFIGILNHLLVQLSVCINNLQWEAKITFSLMIESQYFIFLRLLDVIPSIKVLLDFWRQIITLLEKSHEMKWIFTKMCRYAPCNQYTLNVAFRHWMVAGGNEIVYRYYSIFSLKKFIPESNDRHIVKKSLTLPNLAELNC